MVKAIFLFLIGIFLVILSMFLIPPVREFFKGPFFLVIFAVFSFLGFALIFITLKEKVKGELKKFLLLTGVSSLGFFIGVLLHNFLYALAVITKDMAILHYLMEALQIVFFIMAVFICPIGFLIGIGGSLVVFFKKGKSGS